MTGKVKFRAKSTKDFKPEKKPIVSEITQSDIANLVSAAQKTMSDVLLPTDETMSLLEVTDWITMPESFQKVMSCPGIPCGLVMMIQGKKDSGKTTYAMMALKSVQEDGGIAILLDTENKFSLKRAADSGVDVRRLIIIQAITLEDAFDKFEKMVNLIKGKPEYAKRKILVVWDSLGQTPSEAELDPKVVDFAMTAAKVIKGRFRKMITYISKTKVAFLIINQVYANMNQYGKKTTAYGGSGPEYASSLTLEFVNKTRVRPQKGKKDAPFAGTQVQVECTKNHIGQPFKKIEVMIDWRGFAIDRDVEYAPEPK